MEIVSRYRKQKIDKINFLRFLYTFCSGIQSCKKDKRNASYTKMRKNCLNDFQGLL